MPFYENRAKRNGVPIPIEYIRMKVTKEICTSSRYNDPHYHDYTELLYGISGVAQVRVGEKCYELSAGDLIVIHNFELHAVTATGDLAEYDVVKFLPSTLIAGEQTYFEYAYALLLVRNTHKRQSFFVADELSGTGIDGMFSSLADEWNAQKYGYELGIRAAVTSIYLTIIRRWHMADSSIACIPITRTQGELLQKAVSYIEENYFDLSESEVAKEIGVSTGYLSRVLKRGLGMSFSAYLNGVRLREARQLLTISDKSITEISEQVGFSTPAYFTATFRKKHGCTPSVYRKQQGAWQISK